MTPTRQKLIVLCSAAFLAVSALAAAISAPLAGTGATHRERMTFRVIQDPGHRAIFCAQDGAETGTAYAQTLARDLRRLEETGLTVAESFAYIRAIACADRSSP